jgi:hypothetical protein
MIDICIIVRRAHRMRSASISHHLSIFDVNARMSIAIVRATHLCLRGSRIPTSKMCNRPTPAVGGQSRPRPLPTLGGPPLTLSCLFQLCINEAYDPNFLVSSFFDPRELLTLLTGSSPLRLLLYLLLHIKLNTTLLVDFIRQ